MDQSGSYAGDGSNVGETPGGPNQNYNDGSHNDAVDTLPDGNACCGVAQMKSAPKSPAQVLSIPGVSPDSDYYFMGNEKRGVALVLTHYFHNSEEERKGAEVDRARVEDTFKNLEFDVRPFEDLDVSTIIAELKSLAAEEENKKRDCIAVIVQTHGMCNGKIWAKDHYYEVRNLWEPFIARNCPALAGKPKLFFIQACRGCGVDEGVKATYGARDATDSLPDEEDSFTVPSYADILVSYATFEGQCAFRNEEYGSWYIQTLCDKLLEHARNMELTMLLTRMQKDIGQKFRSRNYKNPELHGKVQAPCYTSSLTRSLMFC